jgi:hypothetical protein
VSALTKEAPIIDPVALKIRAAQRTDARPPPRLKSALDLGAELDGIAQAPKVERETPATAAETRRLRELAITERLERRKRSEP